MTAYQWSLLILLAVLISLILVDVIVMHRTRVEPLRRVERVPDPHVKPLIRRPYDWDREGA